METVVQARRPKWVAQVERDFKRRFRGKSVNPAHLNEFFQTWKAKLPSTSHALLERWMERWVQKKALGLD